MFASTRKLRLFAYTEYREVYPRMGRTIALWGKALSSDPNPQGFYCNLFQRELSRSLAMSIYQILFLS